ncbi:hypothetical protein BPTFM16_01548 [Altererythrobacter insulae]|nr:hypothetical protein BPTFM16_01548 [Altererythrobacter insulae]
MRVEGAPTPLGGVDDSLLSALADLSQKCHMIKIDTNMTIMTISTRVDLSLHANLSY